MTESSYQYHRTKPIWSASFALVLLSSALWAVGFSAFYLLPTYLIAEHGAKASSIGFYVGIASMAAVVCTPVLGPIIARFGLVRSYAFGCLLMAIAAIGFVTVTSPGELVILLRVVQGVSYALILTCTGTLVTQVVDEKRMGQALALSGASMMMMNAFVPPLVEHLYQLYSWDIVFWLAGLSAFAGAVVALYISEQSSASDSSDIPSFGFFTLLIQPLGRAYAITIALVALGFGCAITFHQPAAWNMGRSHVGGFFICYAGMTITFRILFGSFPDRFGRAPAMWLALSLFVLGLSMLALPFSWILEPAALVLGLGHAMFYPATNALVAQQLHPSQRAQMFALYTAAFNLGIGVGVALLGVVAEIFGYSVVFMIATLLVLMAAWFSRGLLPGSTRPSGPRRLVLAKRLATTKRLATKRNAIGGRTPVRVRLQR